MRILFLADNYPPESNAAASRVHERAALWVQEGHEVTVITSAPNFPEGKLYAGYRNRLVQRERIDGVDVIRVVTLIMPNKGVYLRIADFLSYMVFSTLAGAFLRRPDVVVATSPQFFCAVAGWMVSKLKRRPFVFELSDLWPASIRAVGALKNRRVLRWVERMELGLYRKSTQIVALTRAFREDLVSRGIDPAKITVIRNGVDGSRYSPGPRNVELARKLGLEGKLVVGYIGTHGMAHALEGVLAAAELLRDDRRVAFLLVGTGAKREELLRKRDERGLSNVVMLPSQPKESIVEYWRLCNVSLVHLKDDPVFKTVVPSKIFEAMAMGLPILFAGPEGEASSIIEQEGCGVCVPSERPQVLADAVLHLLEDPELVSQLSAASARAAKDHTRQQQATEFLAVLRPLAGRQSAEPSNQVSSKESTLV
ncbi:MAG: glycosyltransferase family 4 protein [Fimbriimonadaceae bacterium]|nr:MAG: Glycosyltransferase [Armatimonadetes bacterium OLB18]WKZ80649.1 MAG: glycosyltransferase family 4 protein [Fimbriimonadaceae bacterium]